MFQVNTMDRNGNAMKAFWVLAPNWLTAVSPPNLNETAYRQAEINCNPIFLISCIFSCCVMRSPLAIALFSSLRNTFVSGAAACERAMASDEAMKSGSKANLMPSVVAAMVAHQGRPVVTCTASRVVCIRSEGHQPSLSPTLFMYPH
ncbi:hypothetical protein OGATHE_004625 [Ogataea polymorpha]|uniref:Uncharacterized protein n=1 Tax=Ogataea polymorpha TaxID=460523 RepID=A0A9P8T2C6_9ASCO|nr:hypothetical protein OGATHE_004625 [Ogataea polymorpha]